MLQLLVVRPQIRLLRVLHANVQVQDLESQGVEGEEGLPVHLRHHRLVAAPILRCELVLLQGLLPIVQLADLELPVPLRHHRRLAAPTL